MRPYTHISPVALLITTAVIILAPLASPSAQGVGPEFRVNDFTAGDQAFPAVAMNASGEFVIAWESVDQDGSGRGVFARRYDASGEPVGPEFQVNTYTAGDQWFAAAALRDDGAFLIAWQSAYQDGDGRGVFARRFDASGNPSGPEFQVNTTTYSNQAFPDVAVNPSTGGFVITWSSAFQDEVHDAAIMRLFDANGLPVTPEFVVNQHTLGFQGYSRVDCSAAGNFVIAYTSWLLDGDGYGIGARRYRDDGAYLDGEFLVNEYMTLYQDYPDVAVSPAGPFVVVWHSLLQDGSGYGIYHRRYRENGAAEGGEVPVNAYVAGNQWWPKAAMDGFGSYTIVWQSDQQDGSGRGVYARRYRSDGAAHTSEFRVNTYTSGDQERPAVACDAEGNFVVVWHSRLQDGSGFGVYAQRFAAGTVPVAFSYLAADLVGESVRLRWRLSGPEGTGGAAGLARNAASDENGGSPGYNVYRRGDGDFARIAGLLPRDAVEYTDATVEPGTAYAYVVGLVDEAGKETISHEAEVTIPVVSTRLFQNYPNPFNPTTRVEYSLEREGSVSLVIYDTVGKAVRTLVARPMIAGMNAEEWDGRDDRGEPVASGVYYCRLTAGGKTLTKKMILLR